MRIAFHGSLLALLLAAPPLAAQTTYYGCPNSDPTTGGSNVIPFGSGTSASWVNQRYQSLVMANFLSGKPSLIRSVGFSPSGSGTINFSAFIILVGHNTSGSLGPSFAASYSGPAFTVVNYANFSWSVVANTWNRIPVGPRPILYNGVDNLVVEVIALGSNNPVGGFHRETEPRFYTTGSNTFFTGAVAPYGVGCPGSSTKTPVFADYSFPMLGVSDFQLGVAGGCANAPAILLVGASNTSFGPLPLPFSLGFLGAAGCSLNTAITLLATGTLDAQGQGKVLFGLPNDQALLGLSLFSQWLLLDPPANPAGLVATEGLQATVGSIAPATPSGGAAALKVEIGLF